MQRRIRFAATSLGQVAYTAVGSGPPLVFDPGWITHLERMWQLHSFAALVDSLATSNRVICFDRPGCGLSTRGRTDFSAAAELEVLTGVIAAVGAPVNILAASLGVPTTISAAATHPEMISTLTLFGGTSYGGELGTEELRTSLPALVRSSWGLGSRLFADIFFPSEPRPALDWYSDFQRNAADAETAARLLESFYDVDVRSQLPLVGAPTLVVHRRDDHTVPLASSQRIAEGIPESQMAIIDGDAHAPYMGDVSALAALVMEFVGEPDHTNPLSARELEVARLVSLGLTNSEIGAQLSISPRTVESHVGQILVKLEVRSRAQIATWVVTHA